MFIAVSDMYEPRATQERRLNPVQSALRKIEPGSAAFLKQDRPALLADATAQYHTSSRITLGAGKALDRQGSRGRHRCSAEVAQSISGKLEARLLALRQVQHSRQRQLQLVRAVGLVG